MTGWHRFPVVKIGRDWLAAAEWFENGRPVREHGFCGTVREARANTADEAAAKLERQIA